MNMTEKDEDYLKEKSPIIPSETELGDSERNFIPNIPIFSPKENPNISKIKNQNELLRLSIVNFLFLNLNIKDNETDQSNDIELEKNMDSPPYREEAHKKFQRIVRIFFFTK